MASEDTWNAINPPLKNLRLRRCTFLLPPIPMACSTSGFYPRPWSSPGHRPGVSKGPSEDIEGGTDGAQEQVKGIKLLDYFQHPDLGRDPQASIRIAQASLKHPYHRACERPSKPGQCRGGTENGSVKGVRMKM